MVKGPFTEQQRSDLACDAWLTLNDIVGEINAARFIYLFAEDNFPHSELVSKNLAEVTKIGMRRAAISAFASAMFRFKECYDGLYKKLKIDNSDAKALVNLIPRAGFGEIRHIAEHVFDKVTGKIHSAEKTVKALKTIDEMFPDLFFDDSKRLIIRVESIRNSIRDICPNVEELAAKRREHFDWLMRSGPKS